MRWPPAVARRRCRSSVIRNCSRIFPRAAAARLREAWGEAADDPDVRDNAFRFRAVKFGNVFVALPPDRGRANERRADYHDPALPPRHALVAFGLWLQHRDQSRCARSSRRARHAGVASGKSRRADDGMLSGDRHRGTAGDLSVHRQQSRRSGAGETPHRRGHAWSSAAAAGGERSCRRDARSRAADRRICAGRRP